MDIQELINDETFAESLASAKSYEAIAKLFADKGVEVTMDELQMIMEAPAAESSDELSAEALEEVAGGMFSVGLPLFKLRCPFCRMKLPLAGYALHLAVHTGKRLPRF